ncbi:hypothetical protein [Streptomyces sp. NEAU-YJ-81]|uniref:hypothetical protein n=1 Tax=Streptomyces sp. NEAU-YJ-81 TaxID=2820288 RepID=UPI001ABBEBF5|nr:hypothetical protein [Streptomyces sp. NEAU-YJ-81]MBO3682269.1 hypothetical protein [Streptomyces sp. NEAU-YJ-81]
MQEPASTCPTRAVLYDRRGGPDVLVVAEVPKVHSGPYEVRAAGINPFDYKVRAGRPPYVSDAPLPRGIEHGDPVGHEVDDVDVAPTAHQGKPDHSPAS